MGTMKLKLKAGLWIAFFLSLASLAPAAGTWTVEKAGDVWWLKSPEGQRQFYTGVQCLSEREGSRVESKIKTWGFTGLGSWNDGPWRHRSLPFTESLNLWHSLRAGRGLKPIFDVDW